MGEGIYSIRTKIVFCKQYAFSLQEKRDLISYRFWLTENLILEQIDELMILKGHMLVGKYYQLPLTRD